jgi:hypothetical protein
MSDAVCFFAALPDAGACDGPTDPHHLVRVQHLRQEYRDDWQAMRRDDRNIVPACRAHHEAFHALRLPVPREALPDALAGFLADYPLLERHADRDYGVGS